MKLRRVVQSDADILFAWSNDSSVRAVSFNSDQITYERHVKWLASRLSSDRVAMFLGEDSNSFPVGIIRFERNEKNVSAAVISITIDPSRRGSGAGRALLQLGLDAVFSSGFCSRVIAHVKESNDVSKRLFERGGFGSTHLVDSPDIPQSISYSIDRVEFWRNVLGESCIAVIPARGGSKRIPGKNIKSFLGKPIIGYSIEAALGSGLFDRVVVSTDSEEIAKVAQQFGAEVPFVRPAHIADDFAPLVDVLIHALVAVQPESSRYNWLCCLLPTAPSISSNLLVEGFRLMREKKASGALTVTSFPSSIFRAFAIGEDGCLSMLWPEHEFTRSNDLKPAYHDAGQLYWINSQQLISERKVFVKGAAPIILPRELVQDIDTPEDWTIAESLLLRHINPNT